MIIESNRNKIQETKRRFLMFKNISRWFKGNYGWFIAVPALILMVLFVLWGFDLLDGGSQRTVYDDVKISVFQSDEFFSAVEDSELVKGISMGRVVVKRHSSAKHRGEFLFSAMIVPYRYISKGERVKLFIVQYSHNEFGTLKDFLLVE